MFRDTPQIVPSLPSAHHVSLRREKLLACDPRHRAADSLVDHFHEGGVVVGD